jgi:uncharacterized protein (DUF2236 family)
VEETIAVSDGTLSRRVNAERIVLLGWGRAILLQLAHPLVAAGVDDHSTFRERPWSPATRLHHTVRAMLALTFGDDAAREHTLEGIRTIHRRVNGTLREKAGRFPAGTPYSAEDPELVLWVHATLLDSIPLVYDLLVSPMADRDRDIYCAEAAPVAVALGAKPDDVPRSWSAARAYLDRECAGGSIAVSAQARRVARLVLAPPIAPLIAPVAWLNRTVTLGLLPPHIREEYGFAWHDREERALGRIVAVTRAVRRATPERLALWPEARRRG